MQLSAWLSKAEVSDADFAGRIRVSRQAVARYKSGGRIPRPAILKRIQTATNDAVRPDDFFAEKVERVGAAA